MLSHNCYAAVTCAVSLMLATLVGCGSSSQSDGQTTSVSISGQSSEGSDVSASPSSFGSVESSAFEQVASAPRVQVNPKVTVTTNLGSFTLELFADKAPHTVENFLENYVDRDYYRDTIFHYVEKDFMVAAGGFTEDLQAKETRAWIRNESRNGLSNRRGTVAMARHPDYPHSATSQFFVNLVDNTSLDHVDVEGDEENDPNGYCVFGEVVQGMDVVDRIAEADVRDQDQFPKVPVEAVVIQRIERAE